MKYLTSMQEADLLGVTKRYINLMCAEPAECREGVYAEDVVG